ncbi:MAG: HPr family phosphocarrier protein [Candidatus Faecousia sp.]|nr:HPr family phosphocarrier protein [Clostridiales bacterium]MDY6180326.1 HPr family phosphocarrier protein [Candidatus Faecousia sp.]
MKEVKTVVVNPNGIHARPASLFIQEAKKFQSKITVENLGTGKAKDAKSILGVMSLGMTKGTEIRIIAEGPDEEAAIQAMQQLVDSGCGE